MGNYLLRTISALCVAVILGIIFASMHTAEADGFFAWAIWLISGAAAIILTAGVLVMLIAIYTCIGKEEDGLPYLKENWFTEKLLKESDGEGRTKKTTSTTFGDMFFLSCVTGFFSLIVAAIAAGTGYLLWDHMGALPVVIAGGLVVVIIVCNMLLRDKSDKISTMGNR